VLDKALERKNHDKGGRPAYDAVLMFKVLVLQSLQKYRVDRSARKKTHRLRRQGDMSRARQNRRRAAKQWPT
jgi:transposase